MDNGNKFYGRSLDSELSDPNPSAVLNSIPKPKDIFGIYEKSELPQEPIVHQKTGVVLSATCRIDGSSEDCPWNFPEPVIVDRLRNANIFQIEDSMSLGIGGSFLCYATGVDDVIRPILLKFDTIGFDDTYNSLGDEYGLSVENHDIIRREQAAYEISKALGCEDIVAPLAAVQSNLVPLISDEIVNSISNTYGIDPLKVEETFGIVAIAQLVPLNATNFVEHWASLGADDKNRFARATDALRHGIYRFLAIDFIFGTASRTLADLLFNRANGNIVVYGFGPSMPSPASSADWYMSQRDKGWRRDSDIIMRDVQPGMPVSGSDVVWMMYSIPDDKKKECLTTFEQMTNSLDAAALSIAIKASIEYGVPLDNLAGVVSRIVFLQQYAEELMEDKFKYMKDFLVPLRMGTEIKDTKMKRMIESINQVMSSVTGQEYDFAQSMR